MAEWRYENWETYAFLAASAQTIGRIRDLGAQLSMNPLLAHFELCSDLDLPVVTQHGQGYFVVSLAAFERS